MNVVFDRLVSSGSYFDRFVDVTGTPFINSLTGAKDGSPMTVTGTGFDASGNTLWSGDPNDISTPSVQIPLVTQGTTSLITGNLNVDYFSLNLPTPFYAKNSTSVVSNVVSTVISPQTGHVVKLIDQEFLGNPSTRIESNPPLSLGNEVESDDSDVILTGQGAFSTTKAAFNARVFDGDQWGSYALQQLGSLSSSITVPNVLGLTTFAASAAISTLGLVPVVQSSVPSSTIAIDHVAAQFPNSGDILPSGGTVELTISLGSSVVLVPNLIGLPQADAEFSRSAAGLVGSTFRSIDGNHTGNTINQSVSPGTLVSVGSAVNIVVSSNQIPDVTGLYFIEASSILTAAGLTVNGTFSTGYSNNVPVDYVIAQSPTADSTVAPLDPVTLTLSLGSLVANASGKIQKQGSFRFNLGLPWFSLKRTPQDHFGNLTADNSVIRADSTTTKSDIA